MNQSDIFKNFIEVTKRAQENRDNQKLEELQIEISDFKRKYESLQKEHHMMKQTYEEQLKEIRAMNIRLQSQNKAIKMRNNMLESKNKEEQGNEKKRFNPNQMAAFRIVQQENKKLKELLKNYISESSS